MVPGAAFYQLLSGGNVPDIIGVVPDGPVGGEDTGPGNVDEGHLVPMLVVGIGGQRALVSGAVAVKVGQKHILVSHAASSAEEKTAGEAVIGDTVIKAGGNLINDPLVGTLDRFNDAKRAEVEDRVKHGLSKNGTLTH